MVENNQTGVSFQGQTTTPGQGEVGPQPSAPGQVQEQGAEPQSQSFVTQADFEKRLETLASQLSSQIQSFSDKSESRLSQTIQQGYAELDKKFAELAMAGTPVSEAVQKEEKDRILRDALRQEVTQASPQGETVQVAGLDLDNRFLGNRNYVNYQAFLLASNAGFIVEPGDPEASSIKSRGSALEYLESYAQALQQKAVRTGKVKPQQGATPQSAGTAGNVPSTGGEAGESWQNINDPDKLLSYVDEL